MKWDQSCLQSMNTPVAAVCLCISGYNSLFLSRLVYDRCYGFKWLVWLTWSCSYLCFVCLKSVQWIKIWRLHTSSQRIFQFLGKGRWVFRTDSIKLWVHIYLIFASFLPTSIKAPKTFFIQVFPVLSTQFLCTSTFHSLKLSLGCSAQVQHY